ncbi:hypothetical protein BC831DRAFT_486759 [Entophlyctis helioformis]|nr:hypothetical protein BC831DRAFT_486759 [Entophlyctis helioformis]
MSTTAIALAATVAAAAVGVALVAAGATRAAASKAPVDPTTQRVVILGASSGIGHHLALQYAARGARLLLVARRRDRLESVQAECIAVHPSSSSSPSSQPPVHVLVGDITIESDMEAAVRASASLLGGVDVLVLCAGVTSLLPFADLCALDSAAAPSTSRSLVETVFQTNVIGPMMTTKRFLPTLKASKAQILVISSAASVIAAPTRSIYSASKHALTGFFRALRIELAPSGVTVCIALPGTVDTELRRSAVDGTGSASKYSGSSGIPANVCASIIIAGSDRGDHQIYMPWFYYYVHVLSVIVPSVIDGFAAKKYNYKM